MVNWLIIFAAQYLYIIVVLLALLAWTRLPRGKQFRAALQTAIGLLLAVLLVKVAGTLFPDVRPFVAGHFTPLIPHAADNGFPSDHTTFTMLVSFVIFSYSRTWGWLLISLAALVGLGRIGAGVHSLRDIIGGIVIAAIAAASAYYVSRWFTNIWQKKSRSTPAS